MHILNPVQANLIYNTNHNLFLWIEIFISTMDPYNTTGDRWSCHLENRNKMRLLGRNVDVSDFWTGVGHFDRPLHVEGDVAHQPLLGGRKLEGSPFHVV